jgi:prepilin-type processing-associated H-X9-DG protein
MLHVDAYGYYPSGGWGAAWVGVPGRGAGIEQPGGWGYNVLPFIEEGDLHQLGAGPNVAYRRQASRQRLMTVIPLFYCPTRREVKLYPAVESHSRQPRETEPVAMVARNDYAANSGDRFAEFGGGPSSLVAGDDPNFRWPDFASLTGLVHVRSQVEVREVADGTSKTYFVGEKYLNPDHYATGRAPGDNESVYSGAGQDMNRWTSIDLVPMRDRPGLSASKSFGSAHPSGLNMMFCDGSVRHLRFNLDADTHRRLGNRHDSEVTDLSNLD